MNRSDLIEKLSHRLKFLPDRDIQLSVLRILEIMSQTLAKGDRIEIRGFGSFSLHHIPPRKCRNPKTGETVVVKEKYLPHFKPGKELRKLVDEGMHKGRPIRKSPRR